MGYFDAQFITEKGTALLARLAAGEGNITFTSLHTGDGEYSLPEISKITSAEFLKRERQRFPINDVDSRGESTRVRAVISNHELESGYYIKEIGLFAKMGEEDEILFSISVCSESPTFLPEMNHVPLELPVTNYITYSGDGNFTVEYRSDVYATLDMVRRISTEIGERIQDAYENANQFTLNKIAELINGASTTMDTLKEIEDAMTSHQSVVNALDAAIGKKANQTELDTHMNNGTIHFTAGERQQLASLVGEFGNKANAVAPLFCTTLPNNLKSTAEGSGKQFNSNMSYRSVANSLANKLNGTYVDYSGNALSSLGNNGYRILKEGYYYVQFRAKMTAFDNTPSAAVVVDRVKRVRIYTASSVNSTSSTVIAATEGRVSTYELLMCQTIQYFQKGAAVLPVLQMDAYGSTTIIGTWDFYLEIIPLFIKP